MAQESCQLKAPNGDWRRRRDVKALLVELRQSQRNRLQRVKSRRIQSCEAASSRRRRQTWAEQATGEVPENKSPREERVGLSIGCSESTRSRPSHRYGARESCEIVGKFVAPHDRQLGGKSESPDLRNLDIEPPDRGCWNHVKVVVAPLHAGFIRGARAELVNQAPWSVLS